MRTPPKRRARAFWWTGCCRLYCDGDVYSGVFHWWHPLTWLLWLIFLVVGGMSGTSVFETVPLRLSPYWRERRQDVIWWSPWTRKISYLLPSESALVRKGRAT